MTVSDPVMYGKIQLTKYALNTVSDEKQPEKGATFTIYLKSAGSYDKAKDSERDIITIGKNGKGASKSLPYGVYCVQQRTGWAGYDRDETIYEVTISKDGQTVTKDNSGHDLTLYNSIWTGKLSILKVDGTDNAPLSGAVFTLTGSDGSESTLTTGEDGTVTFENLVFGVTYVWKEVQAPISPSSPARMQRHWNRSYPGRFTGSRTAIWRLQRLCWRKNTSPTTSERSYGKPRPQRSSNPSTSPM